MQGLYQKIRNIGFIKQLRDKRIQQQSAFYEENRKIVLDHYRYLLKTVPSLYQRRLQQRSIYIEICHLFHESKVLSSIQQTRSRNLHLQQLVKQIKAGDYGNIGIYLPARQGEIEYIKSFFDRFKYRFNF